MRKYLFGFLVISALVMAPTLVSAQEGPVEDPDATNEVTVEVDVPDADLEVPEGDFELTADTTPPTILFKILPNRPIAGKDLVNIEISTENLKTNELTEGVFMEVTIDYPKKPFFLPTTKSNLEGTQFFTSEFTSRKGVVLLENVLFPIRGTYSVTVEARPIDGQSFEPITETFTIRVWASVLSTIIWLAVFALVFLGGKFLHLKLKK